MGSTNSTPNYELSQFIGTDKPAWLQDYNGDMLKIDTGIAGAKTAADNAQSAADGAQGDATSALSGIADINTELGTVENTLGTAVGNINTINALIGNGTPTTTDQTIIGAINELHSDITAGADTVYARVTDVGDPEYTYTSGGVVGLRSGNTISFHLYDWTFAMDTSQAASGAGYKIGSVADLKPSVNLSIPVFDLNDNNAVHFIDIQAATGDITLYVNAGVQSTFKFRGTFTYSV